VLLTKRLLLSWVLVGLVTTAAAAGDLARPVGPAASAARVTTTASAGLAASARVEVARSLAAGQETGRWSGQSLKYTPQAAGSWFKRHPVWFGALVGAALGTPIAYAKWGAEGSFIGFWGGAAAGALVGATAGK
jgi:hypothetical protein